MVDIFHKRRNQYTDRWKDIPEGHRPCSKCEQILPFALFNKSVKGAFGLASICKPCYAPISKETFQNRPLERRMLDQARSRIKTRGWECDIDETDIMIPEFCPVLGTRLESSQNHPDANNPGFRKDNSPSLDRIDSSKGYIKGNVRVISLRANMLKNNGTLEEMKAIVVDLERIEAEKNKSPEGFSNMTRRQRRTDIPFTLEELETINDCLFNEEPLELVGTLEESFRTALQVQLPYLFNAWRAKDRADAEMFYEQNLLREAIKIMKEEK